MGRRNRSTTASALADPSRPERQTDQTTVGNPACCLVDESTGVHHRSGGLGHRAYSPPFVRPTADPNLPESRSYLKFSQSLPWDSTYSRLWRQNKADGWSNNG